jgi:hypothetical protein
MFDVGRSFFILAYSSVFNRRCCIQIYASSGALKLERVKANSIEVAKIIDNYHIPARSVILTP